jgi:hypothetical protein
VESEAGSIEPTKRANDAVERTRWLGYQPLVVEIPTPGQHLHRTSPKLEAAAGHKACQADSYDGSCRAIILHIGWSTPPPCSDDPFPARIHLSAAENDLQSVAGSGSMRRLSGAIPVMPCTDEWFGWMGKGWRLIPTFGRGDWWSAVWTPAGRRGCDSGVEELNFRKTAAGRVFWGHGADDKKNMLH